MKQGARQGQALSRMMVVDRPCATASLRDCDVPTSTRLDVLMADQTVLTCSGGVAMEKVHGG